MMIMMIVMLLLIMMMIGLTPDELAERSGHEECVKAIDDYFAELCATSADHQPSSTQADTAVNQPGDLCILTYISANIRFLN